MTITVTKTLTTSKAALAAAEMLAKSVMALNAADQDYAVQYTYGAYTYATNALKKTLQLMANGGVDNSDGDALDFADEIYSEWLECGENVEYAITASGYKIVEA